MFDARFITQYKVKVAKLLLQSHCNHAICNYIIVLHSLSISFDRGGGGVMRVIVITLMVR